MILLIWCDVPERIRAYYLDRDDAELAKKVHNRSLNLNNSKEDDDNLDKLSNILTELVPVWDSYKINEARTFQPIPVDSIITAVVIAGYVL